MNGENKATPVAIQPGDYVKCIDSFGIRCLKENHIYEIIDINYPYLQIKNDGAPYPAIRCNRFRIVDKDSLPFKLQDKVVCIADKGAKDLHEGSVYIVEDIEYTRLSIGIMVSILGTLIHCNYNPHRFKDLNMYLSEFDTQREEQTELKEELKKIYLENSDLHSEIDDLHSRIKVLNAKDDALYVLYDKLKGELHKQVSLTIHYMDLWRTNIKPE